MGVTKEDVGSLLVESIGVALVLALVVCITLF